MDLARDDTPTEMGLWQVLVRAGVLRPCPSSAHLLNTRIGILHAFHRQLKALEQRLILGRQLVGIFLFFFIRLLCIALFVILRHFDADCAFLRLRLRGRRHRLCALLVRL